jgi:hypothetical protein
MGLIPPVIGHGDFDETLGDTRIFQITRGVIDKTGLIKRDCDIEQELIIWDEGTLNASSKHVCSVS